MFKITDWLATHGLGETTYPAEKIRTGEKLEGTDFTIVDVRLMLDEPQPVTVYKNMITIAMNTLEKEKKIVVCCGAGISRSNAIALAVLMIKTNMDYDDALKMVEEKVPIAQIEPCHLKKIKGLFGVQPPFTHFH